MHLRGLTVLLGLDGCPVLYVSVGSLQTEPLCSLHVREHRLAGVIVHVLLQDQGIHLDIPFEQAVQTDESLPELLTKDEYLLKEERGPLFGPDCMPASSLIT